MNGRYAATEGTSPWRIFGDRGAKNDGSYVWSTGAWSVGVWALAPSDVALSSRTWSFTIVDRPDPVVVDVETALLHALAVILPSHSALDNRAPVAAPSTALYGAVHCPDIDDAGPVAREN